MLRITPMKLCGLLLLLCLVTTVLAFNLFGSSKEKKADQQLSKRQFIDDDDYFDGNEYPVGDENDEYPVGDENDEYPIGGDADDEYDDTIGQPLEEEEEEVKYVKKYKGKHNGKGKYYTDDSRIATEYTTVTGNCIQGDVGQQYYTQYNNIQRYFQMGIYGRPNVGSSPRAIAAPFNAPLSAPQEPTCDTDPTWNNIRDHWNAIFFGDYIVAGYQQTLGPLAVRGNFRGNDYVISTNHQFQCSDDVQLANTAFVVGGTVSGSVVIARGMSYVGNLAGSIRVSGTCPAKQGNGPVDWPEYYTYWTKLSEAYSQLMPTHFIDNNKVMNTVNPGTTNNVNVFTFNTCNSFNCPLWPGLLSTPDNIFSGYGTWDGPVGRYPSSGTLLFNIPVDDGTIFNIDSIHPSINADYCRTIYNVYPADADGNYLPEGHITIRRNTVDMIRGLFIAPQADIQDGPTGRFGGMLVGYNYSWQRRQGVEIDDWGAAANGAYYCSRFTGCVIGPTPTNTDLPTPTSTEPEPTPIEPTSLEPEPTPIEPTDCPEPETFTDCQTTVSSCTATSCTATVTFEPDRVTVTTTGDCVMTPPVTITNTETRTDFVVSTETDCTATSTQTNNIVGPTRTVTVTEVESHAGIVETITLVETETAYISTCPDLQCTLTDEFCLDTITYTEPAICTDFATVTTSVICTETELEPTAGQCTGTETHCIPTPTTKTLRPTITHTHTQTITYVPGCDDYRYPDCSDDDDDDDDGDDDDDHDYFKRKKHGKNNHHHKENHWNKKKKMDDD